MDGIEIALSKEVRELLEKIDKQNGCAGLPCRSDCPLDDICNFSNNSLLARWILERSKEEPK